MSDPTRDPADRATPAQPASPTVGPADDLGTRPVAEQDPDVGPGASADPGTTPDRRTFLNSLSRDAVSTAGRVAGLSSMLRRSMFAAGEAMVGALDPQAAESAAESGTATPGVTTPPTVLPVGAAIPTGAAASALPASAAAAAAIAVPEPVRSTPTRTTPDAVATLTADQQDFLARRTSAILGVNAAGSPHLTMSACDWDGERFRLPGQQFTLRVSNVESDPRVSLFIDEPTTGWSVTVTGVATLVYGEAVAAAMLRLLERDGARTPALERWEELRASGDRMIIEIRPSRFVWRRP